MVTQHSDRLPEKQCSSKLVPELLTKKNNKYEVYEHTKT